MDQFSTTRRGVLCSALGVLPGVALAGCTSNGSDESAAGGDAAGATTTTEPTEEGTEQPAVTILDHEWVVIEEYDSDAVEDDYGVVGTAENNREERLDVFVDARFYDSSDVQIESTTTSMSGVSGGGTFEFELPYLGDDSDDVARYELGWEAYEP